MNQNTLLCHLREMEFLLHDIKNKDLDIMTSYKCSINSLDKNLQQLIFFANNHYPRIMTNAREYFMRAFRMRDIKLFSKEFYYLCEGIEYIINDIVDYNLVHRQLPGQSRRKLASSIEIFMIVVLRICYTLSFIRNN